MITVLRAHETVSGYTIRAWTGPATDEGVGLISMLEVSDPSGRPVCRFEMFLPAVVQNSSPTWPGDEEQAADRLQEEAVDKARTAILSSSLADLHGHRYDIS